MVTTTAATAQMNRPIAHTLANIIVQTMNFNAETANAFPE